MYEFGLCVYRALGHVLTSFSGHYDCDLIRVCDVHEKKQLFGFREGAGGYSEMQPDGRVIYSVARAEKAKQ